MVVLLLGKYKKTAAGISDRFLTCSFSVRIIHTDQF